MAGVTVNADLDLVGTDTLAVWRKDTDWRSGRIDAGHVCRR